MYKQLVSVYKESLIYTIGNFANKIIGFILIPVYTAYLPLEDYGVLGLTEPLTQLLFTVLGLGLNSAFMRWYSINRAGTDLKVIFFNTNLILILDTLALIAGITIFAEQISVSLFNTSQYTWMLRLSFFNVFFMVVLPTYFSTLRVEHRALEYSFVRAAQFLINLVLNIYLIVGLKLGLIAIFISQLISSVLIFIYFIPMLISHSSIKFDQSAYRPMLKFGLPLIPVGISNLAITMLNRFILEKYDTLATVGLYSFAYRLSNTIKVTIIESITLSLTPILYQKLADSDGKRFIQKNYQYSVLIVLMVYLVASGFSREFIFYFAQNKEYYDAYLFFPIIGYAFLFNTMLYFYTILLNYAKLTLQISVLTAITAVFSIIINYLLIPEFKGYGAAAATILSEFIQFILFWYYSKKHFGNYFDNRKILILFSIATMLLLIIFTFFNEVSIANFLIKIGLCLLFPVLLYPFNFYEKVEIERFLIIFNRFRSNKG
jgi:O-antigen/teichoic acid export membrane protein